MNQRREETPSPLTSSAPSSAGLGHLTVGASSLVHEHRERWRRGERIPVERFVERPGGPVVATTTLLDLVYNEVLLREEDGEAPGLEEYLSRFPAHAEALRAQFEVHQALRSSGTFSVTLASTGVEDAPESSDHEPGGALRVSTAVQPDHETSDMGFRPASAGETRAAGTSDRPATPASPSWPRIEGFDILGELGSGGMGTVYLAFDRKSRRRVALKTMNRAGAMALLRFKSEFRHLLDVAHPNLVTLHELICDGGTWILSMELLYGVDFLRHIRGDAARTVGRLPGDGYVRLREAMRQLAEGVEALDAAGKLHRDIKPSNVMVTREGRVVLLDFGLAAEQDDVGEHHSTEHHLVGTAAYMAPEQAGGLAVSPASDWYSVGVMLFESLTGRLPFLGGMWKVIADKQRFDPSAPSDLLTGIPEDLDSLCNDLLRREPERRPRGAEILHRLGGPDSAEIRRSADETPSAVRIANRPRHAGLVGRERHQASLDEALAALGQGRPVAVFLEGTSGAGKSALLQKFLTEQTERDDTVVLSGRCYERESVPYKALDSLIDSLGRYLGRLEAPEAEAILPRDVAPLARVFPSLGRVEAVARAPRRGVEAPDPQELRRRAFTALRELFARLGDRRRLILAIDDLQWGDVDSGALLTELFRPPDAPVLLFLAAYRREDRATSPLLQLLDRSGLLGRPESLDAAIRASLSCRQILVEPLDPRQARELALELLVEDDPSRSPPEEPLVDRVVRESAGNPFFLVELVRYVRAEADRVQQSPEADRSTGHPPQGLLGTEGSRLTLTEMLLERIRRLPFETREILELISISGRPLRIEELGECTGPAHDARVSLARLLCAERLIRSTGRAVGDEVETYHDRIRETVVASLETEVAREHHGRLAAVMEASGQVDPEVLGMHFLGAGLPENARVHLARAADQASEALAFERAAALYRVALDLPNGEAEEGMLRVRLGDALANAGRGPEAAAAYLDAVPCVPPSLALDLLRRAAMQSLISGHMDEGLDTLRTVLEKVGMTLPATPRRALASLLWQRAKLRWRGLGFRERQAEEIDPEALNRIDVCWSASVGLSVVDTVRGADFQCRGLLLALDAGEPGRIARALAMEAAHSASLGTSNGRRTQRLLEIADELTRRVDHPYADGMVTLARGVSSYLQGRWTAAQQSCDQAEAIFRDRCTGVAWEINTANAFSLWGLSHQGQIAELSRRWPVLLAQARERGNLYAAMNLSSYLMSIVKLAADDPVAAREGLRETSAKWSRQGYHVQHNDALWAAVQIELYCGDGIAAWETLERSWPLLRGSLLLRVQFVRTSMRFLRARAALAAAVALRRSEPARFRSLLAGALRDARRLSREAMPCADAYARMIEGGVAALRGDHARGALLLTEAATAFDGVDMLLCSGSARRRAGELLGGDPGRDEVRRSEDWMASQGIHSPSKMAAMILTELS